MHSEIRRVTFVESADIQRCTVCRQSAVDNVLSAVCHFLFHTDTLCRNIDLRNPLRYRRIRDVLFRPLKTDIVCGVFVWGDNIYAQLETVRAHVCRAYVDYLHLLLYAVVFYRDGASCKKTKFPVFSFCGRMPLFEFSVRVAPDILLPVSYRIRLFCVPCISVRQKTGGKTGSSFLRHVYPVFADIGDIFAPCLRSYVSLAARRRHEIPVCRKLFA